MGETFVNFLRDQSGATPIEYGAIAFGISLFVLAGATSLGEHVKHLFRVMAFLAMHGSGMHG